MKKIISFDDLTLIRSKHPNKKIIHCHGVFDLLHHGHFLHLNSAKNFGDILVVTVTSDEYVNKGPQRPYYSANERATMLSSIESVDYVSISNYERSSNAIKLLKPDYYVKGEEYRDEKSDITEGIIEERNEVLSIGGQIIFTQDPVDSSTKIINKYFSNWSKDQENIIDKIKLSYSTDDIISIIDNIKNLNVLVVGEALIDSYVYCNAENKATKSPIISAQYLFEEEYKGGSLAITNHLADLNCNVTLLTVIGDNNLEMFDNNLDQNICYYTHKINGSQTLKKTRFIEYGHNEKLFEITFLNDNQWKDNSPKSFINDLIDLSKKADLVIISDFGHGLFEGEVIQCLKKIKKFTALNVQSNSGNLGFNLYTKHKHTRYDYLCLDSKEYRLGLHNRLDTPEKMMEKNAGKKFSLPAAITLGPDGSIFIDESGNQFHCPIFFEDIVDTTGAGDAYFLMTSLLVYLKVDPLIIPFLGNCHAGLKTRIVGNKKSVSKIDLIRTIKSILD